MQCCWQNKQAPASAPLIPSTASQPSRTAERKKQINRPMIQASYDVVFVQLLGFDMAEKATTRKMNQIKWKIAAGNASTGTSSAASAQRLPNI